MFLVAIRDINFKQSVGIHISKLFYVVSLAFHGIFLVGGIVSGLYFGFNLVIPRKIEEYNYFYDSSYTVDVPGNPIGFLLIFGALIVVPIVTVLGVFVSRYVFEWYNAVIHTAENTKK